MEFHEIAAQFPLMQGEEFDALVRDIAEHGQLEPVWLYQGQVLDGRNRWRACERLGLVPDVQEWEGDDPDSFVISKNLYRRHLTKEQRDELIRAKRAQGWTLQKIADAVGVSVDTAHRVARDTLISDFGIENARGQQRPAQYAPREQAPKLEDAHIVRATAGWYWQDGTGMKECRTCGSLWAADLEYCPYCHISPEVRALHLEQEKKIVPPHVTFNTGNNEWYTPAEYIEAAREVMGGIDLDPASSEIANHTVRATTFYTQRDDGLLRTWKGRVWMNPPYSSSLIGPFADKLSLHVQCGDVSEACVLVNNATETAWFNTLLALASCVCFIRGRVRFIDAGGNPSGAPLQGQALLYIGPNVDAFAGAYSKFGTVLYARRDSA